MDRDTYKELKESGGLVTDAALQEESKEVIAKDDLEVETETDKGENQEPETKEEELEEEDIVDEDDDLPELSEKEKTAFQKRLEREQAKIREKVETELKEQLEQQYGKHKAVIDLLGGDPEAIEKRIREAEMTRQAQSLAKQNGWSEEQTKLYVEQLKQAQELKELRVQNQINRLKDHQDYAGIASMEKDIMSLIDKSGGSLTVEQAYWALGGPKRAEQVKLEAKMREAEKRKEQKRTVQPDSPTSAAGEKPLPADVLKDAERMGISAEEARRLMKGDPAQSLDEWRKRKAK